MSIPNSQSIYPNLPHPSTLVTINLFSKSVLDILFRKSCMYSLMKRIPTLGLTLRQFSQGQSCLRILLRNFTSFFVGKKAAETITTLFWRCNNSSGLACVSPPSSLQASPKVSYGKQAWEFVSLWVYYKVFLCSASQVSESVTCERKLAKHVFRQKSPWNSLPLPPLRTRGQDPHREGPHPSTHVWAVWGWLRQASEDPPQVRLSLQGSRQGPEQWREEEAGECSHGGGWGESGRMWSWGERKERWMGLESVIG